MTPDDEKRLKDIEARALVATEGPILEREDLDYYQAGTYLGVGPQEWENGGYVPVEHPGDGEEFFGNFEKDIFRVEEGKADTEMFKHARADLLWLVKKVKDYDDNVKPLMEKEEK